MTAEPWPSCVWPGAFVEPGAGSREHEHDQERQLALDEALAGAADELVRLLGDRVRRHVDIGASTTYRVGGRAAVHVEVGTAADLTAVAGVASESGVPVLVLGKGSNLLVADGVLPALVVELGDGLAAIHIDAETGVVRAGGAAALPVVARRTVAAGLSGFEWAVGVPGSVGGAVRMNAGGHGSDLAATLIGVGTCDLATGLEAEVPAAELTLGYRSSAVSPSTVVVWADLHLVTGDRSAGERELAEIVRWRREHQPGGQNAGSVFANPEGDSAGRLIEAAGCKGRRLGTAMVSPKHANFFIADPGGRANDVYALMVAVRDQVAASTGVLLHPETRLAGFSHPRSKVEG